MKPATALALALAAAAAPALGSCSSVQGSPGCFGQSDVSLPTADKVRARLSNGEAGRRAYDAVASGDLAALESLVHNDPRLLSTHAVLAEGERPSNGNVGDLLAFAVASCRPETVAALLELGADPDGNPAGLPLTLAALADDPLMATMLLQAGASADAHDENLSSPLREALYFERSDSVALLLRGGADPNRVDAVGGTPLAAAMLFADYRSAEELLRAGANPWQVANKGVLPARLLVEPVKDGGDEALRQRLVSRVRENAPIWPPPPASEVRDKVLGKDWPTAAMAESGFAVTPQAMSSMQLAQRAGE